MASLSGSGGILRLLMVAFAVCVLLGVSCGGEDAESVPTSNESVGAEPEAGQPSGGQGTIGGRQADTRLFPLDPATGQIRWPGDGPTPGLATLETRVAPNTPLTRGQARALRLNTGDTGFSSASSRCLLDDYRLENERVLVCIQGRRSFSPLTENGGQIIDARRRAAGYQDGMSQLIIAPEVGEVDIRHMGIVADGSEGGDAVIRVEGIARGMRLLQGLVPNTFVPPALSVITEYRLAPDDDRVRIYTWVVGDDSYDIDFRLYDFLLFSGQSTLISWPPELFTREWIAAEDAGSAYSFQSLDGTFDDFLLVQELIPAIAAEHRSVRVRGFDAHLYARVLRIGERDIESARPPIEPAVQLTVVGRSGTRISIADDTASPLTRGYLNAEGQRTFRLQPGQYTVSTQGYGGGDVTVVVDIGDMDQQLLLAQSEPATLTIKIIDEATGQPMAGRLNLTGPDNRLVNIVDDLTLELPAGDWSGTVTHGWHFSVEQQAWSLSAGESAIWTVALREVLPTPGWASGEFHQHASPSIDSERPVDELIRANLAEGVDFMVPSDHDVLFDYGQRVAQLGYEERIGTPLTGVEVSPTYAHMGAYGLPYDPKKPAGGAPAFGTKEDAFWRTMEMPELVDWVRKNGARLVQLNHPRGSQSYFEHVDYEPDVDVSGLDPKRWTANFDAIEIFNGQRDFCRVFQDWMGLLNQGIRMTALGNSDTHRPDVTPGYPRNYLPTVSQDPRQVTADEVVTAIKDGIVTIGGGAFMDFPDGPYPGMTIEANETVTIRVRVQTPPYAQVDRLQAIFNGVVVLDRAIETMPDSGVDIDEPITVETLVDGHLIFLATGDRSLAHVRPGHIVFAMSNPIWIDVDGGGVDPIGVGGVPRLNLSFCGD
ncbi:MAG: CehA/McbA family metallohydrolase [Myxococcota bacterium]|nr:CehA/McbA family metallohydrolase [Myxococcota bacterium]